MLTLPAIEFLFYYSRLMELLLYFFIENILVIAVVLAVFYVVMKAFLQFQQNKTTSGRSSQS